MKLPQFQVRTLMFVVWLSALLLAGVIDVVRELEERNRVEVLDQHIDADGSVTSQLIFNKRISYYVGPIPLGPWPVAVFSGVAFAVSVVIWGLARRGRRRSG